MNRMELGKYIQDNYNIEPDYPWVKYPNYEVYRHGNNKKWFALVMDVPKNKLGLRGEDILEIVNFIRYVCFLRPDFVWKLTGEWKSYRADEPSEFYLKVTK